MFRWECSHTSKSALSIGTRTEESVSFKPLCYQHKYCFVNVRTSDRTVPLQPSATGTLPADAVAAPCALVVYALRWVGGSALITSNVALIKSANSLRVSLKLRLRLFRFDPEQQRLFETKEHHRFAEELSLAKAVCSRRINILILLPVSWLLGKNIGKWIY